MRFWEFMCHGHCWLYLNEARTLLRCLATMWSGGATLFPASEISLLFHGPKPTNIIQCFSIILFIITPLRSLFRYFLLASPPHILMPQINCISVYVLYICALYTKRIRFFCCCFILFCFAPFYHQETIFAFGGPYHSHWECMYYNPIPCANQCMALGVGTDPKLTHQSANWKFFWSLVDMRNFLSGWVDMRIYALELLCLICYHEKRISWG